MNIKTFTEILNSEFYSGVPDSLLRPLADYLMEKYGEDPTHHIIAANEGNAVALGAGYHLATGKVPVIYMQNSGQGNAVNPIASLLNERVYAIPAIFVVGWRGEPGESDEPQHAFQGEITECLMKLLEIDSFVVSKDTQIDELKAKMEEFNKELLEGKQVCFIIKKGALDNPEVRDYSNGYKLKREPVLKKILMAAKNDTVIATTGKTGREIFEIREESTKGHDKDFLTVGSMGHASSIALGIACQKPDNRIWCIDGDGAAIMHMGAMAVIGKIAPANLIHVIINNRAHESVGGLPTAASKNTFSRIARELGYKEYFHVAGERALEEVLMFLGKVKGPVMVEIECEIGSRDDLGRPNLKPVDNKVAFMKRQEDEIP